MKHPSLMRLELLHFFSFSGCDFAGPDSQPLCNTNCGSLPRTAHQKLVEKMTDRVKKLLVQKPHLKAEGNKDQLLRVLNDDDDEAGSCTLESCPSSIQLEYEK